MGEIASAYITLYPKISSSFKSEVERGTSGIMRSAGDSGGVGFGEGMKVGIGKIAIGSFIGNLLTQGVEAAGAAAASVFADSFMGAAEFEQLAGGVEKIFDQANIAGIMKDAQSAYKDLNMSANEYLAAVNQTGAAFAQTMGDQAGYDAARNGMLAIADYASGTGRSIDELNQKFALITRATSSYQSIADQFSGILPATSADFLAQAQAAGILSDSYEKLTEVPLAEYQQAVTQMLEKGVADMGLAGNTAMESAETMSGSLAMLRSSWSNLLTSFGTGENIEESMQAVVDSIGAVLSNGLPLVERILGSMGDAIGAFAIKAGDYFMAHKTEIFDKVGEFIRAALEAIVTAIPYILTGIVQLVASLIEYIVTHIPDMLAAAVQLFATLVQGLGEAGVQLITALGNLVGDVFNAIAGFVGDMFNAGVEFIGGFINGIIEGIVALPGMLIDGIGGAIDGLAQFLGIASPSKLMMRYGAYTMQGFAAGISDNAYLVDAAMDDAVGNLSADATMTVDAAYRAASEPSAPIGQPGAFSGLVMNVNVTARDGEDGAELGRRIGAAAAYELRMQGVCA